MNKSTMASLKLEDLQHFSTNAARLMLKVQGGEPLLERFFRHLGFEFERANGGYRGVCPVCRASSVFIGVSGTFHPIYWRCFKNACAGNDGYRKNLLGLTKGIVEDHNLGTAIKTISAFLGFAGSGKSFAITNMTAEEIDRWTWQAR